MLFLFSLLLIRLSPDWVSESFHGYCTSFGPNSPFQELYVGIVCGKNLESTFWIQTFAVTGLLHLLVVSGSHLLILYKLATLLRLPPWLILLSCFLYCFVCQLEPPIVRAYIYLQLQNYNQKHRFQWSMWHLHILTITLSLLLFPHWFTSLSFQLSILCAFGLSFSEKQPEIWVYCTLFPALLILGNYHPFSIVVNLLLGPILGYFLFPINILAFCLPFSVIYIDHLWSSLLWLLRLLQPHLLLPAVDHLSYISFYFWIYIVILWLLGGFTYYAKNRRCLLPPVS